MSMFEKDIIEAAKSDQYFDKINAKQIADDHGVEPKHVLKKIKALRQALKTSDERSLT